VNLASKFQRYDAGTAPRSVLFAFYDINSCSQDKMQLKSALISININFERMPPSGGGFFIFFNLENSKLWQQLKMKHI
jgi:hypothetical protein